MADFVRVTDPDTKAHVTITADRAETLGLKPHKSSAVDRFGRPLPAKSRVALGGDSSPVTQDAEPSATTTTTTPKE